MKRLITLLLSLLLLFTLSCNSIDSKIVKEKGITLKNMPLFTNKSNRGVVSFYFQVADSIKNVKIKSCILQFERKSAVDVLERITLFEDKSNNELATCEKVKRKNTIVLDTPIKEGLNAIDVDLRPKQDADLLSKIYVKNVVLKLSNGEQIVIEPKTIKPLLLGTVLRAAGQDNCDTYRIPGLTTTNNGTLIAVYDNRYNNSKDLQENVDIGMSRSTDGGQTWEPMKVIMDMGEWGNNPQQLNGVGDPSVLFDTETNTLWVAALWMSGATVKDMLWWRSKPGMEPTETGQFLLVKSTDDGKTWSRPINITKQIKNPDWQLLFQGPGKGITMKDGTIVFPAQFKADIGTKSLDGGQFTAHSTIIYSKDHGKTWQIGTGAKSNTTEAQVVELENGKLMLNMRDDRNRRVKDNTNGRAIYTTDDLGITWQKHSTSNSALIEPNCMASLITAGNKILLFSNPNHKQSRIKMTIKASKDNGNTWEKENQIELYEDRGFGYSCMTMIDDETVGIIYEGIKEIYFQKLKLNDIIKQ